MTMTFEKLFNRYKSCFNRTGCNHSFVYDGKGTFSQAVNQHFKNCNCRPQYCVYISICLSACEIAEKNETIYIGKAGTIKNDGSLKAQDIPGRLTAPRHKSNGNEWWSAQFNKYGPLKIEYICLPDKSAIAPALLEAHLIQAFLNQYGRLPKENNAF
jgi:hypothetical protein